MTITHIHWTSLYSAHPLALLPLSDMRPEDSPPAPVPLPMTSGDHHWIPVQTCSLDLTVQLPLPRADIYWQLKRYSQYKQLVRILQESFL